MQAFPRKRSRVCAYAHATNMCTYVCMCILRWLISSRWTKADQTLRHSSGKESRPKTQSLAGINTHHWKDQKPEYIKNSRHSKAKRQLSRGMAEDMMSRQLPQRQMVNNDLKERWPVMKAHVNRLHEPSLRSENTRLLAGCAGRGSLTDGRWECKLVGPPWRPT